ncbi:MAG: aldehyde dehydrogenase [Gammaproteobacteria bacterium]|nr:aldehyde dehydrogenase [Gammaproteobacteria bacterium]
MNTTKHYINGNYISGGIGFMQTVNPYTLQPFSKIEIGSDNEINFAVTSAKEAFSKWKYIGVTKRIDYVKKIASWLENEYGETGYKTKLKELIKNEMGKPLPETDIEIIESVDFINYFCNEATNSLNVKKNKLDNSLWPNKKSIQVIEPIGVIGIIKPWNYPLEMIIWSMIPALLTGNTVVIKPSEKSSLVALELAKAVKFSNIPDGVVNIVTGNSGTGKKLVAHKNIGMISFTGSVDAGKNVSLSCAKNLKKCTLELGGNDCAIVTKNANIDLAVNGIIWGSFTNAGQVCVGIKQVLVEKSIADILIKKLVEKTRLLKIGKDIGPIVDESQLNIALSMLQDAKNKGAKFLTGGTRNKELDGYFLNPAIITNLKENMELVNKECFAPVMPIYTVDSINDAIKIANNSKYGLGASIWTENKLEVESLASQLNVGMIWHNDVNIAFPSAVWSGRKNSGLGQELSATSFEEYGYKKHICFEESYDSSRDWWYPYSSLKSI